MSKSVKAKATTAAKKPAPKAKAKVKPVPKAAQAKQEPVVEQPALQPVSNTVEYKNIRPEAQAVKRPDYLNFVQ